MRIRTTSEHGNALLIALFTAGVVGLALLTYLSLVGSHNRANHRSQAWNASLTIAEAGLEEAIAHLNQNKGRVGSGLACCGWTGGGANYSLRRTVGDHYFVVNISSNVPPMITSRGYVKVPLATNYLSRTVQVICTNRPGGGGLTMKNFLDMNGNNIVIDSFNSRDPAASTLGLYDPAKRRDGVLVTIEGGARDSLDIGNGDIWGMAAVGPGTTFRVGASGSLGNMAWHNAGMSGIQPEALTDDASVSIPDAPDPPGGAVPPLVALPGSQTNGVPYELYLLDKGVYQVTQLDKSTYVFGKATLIVSGATELNLALLTIGPNAGLTLYCYGVMNVTSANIINTTQRAENLLIYGMNTCTAITLNGSATFTGQIYAPHAAVKAGGGGSTLMGFCGSLTALSFTMNGHFSFHYDEALQMLNSKQNYRIISWNEL